MSVEVSPDKKATEYLANERTYLAWIRTSIAIMSLGFVVAKFSVWMRELVVRLAPGTPVPGVGMSMPIGVTMMAFGGMLALIAAWHYHDVNKAIERGHVRAKLGLVLIVTFAIALLAIVMIASMLLTSEHL
jgi:putative membrane protein